MARETGNGVTIGSSVNNNYLYIDWSTVDEPSNNRTLVYWAVGFHYTSSDAQLDDVDASLNGLRYDVPGRVKNYAGTFTTRDHGIASSSFYVDHDTNGNASITISGSIGGSLSARSTIGERSYSLSNYTRTPSTSKPSFISRNRESISMSTVGSLPGGTNAAPAITSYTWQVSTDASSWSTISGQTSSTLSYTAPSATTQYYFRVLATNNEGSGSYSSSSDIVSAAPDQPSAPALSRNSLNVSVTLTTPSANGSTLSSFSLEYSTASDFPTEGPNTRVVISNITSSTQSVPNLTAGTTYYFRYKIGSNRGDSLYSPIANITMPDLPAAPVIPAALTKQVRKVTIDWNAPSGTGFTVSGYEVESRFSSDNGATWDTSFTNIATTNSSTTIFVTPDLNIAKLYQFRVRALTDIGNSEYSSTASVTEFNSIFISAYGYRHDGTNFNTAIQFAARYTGNLEDSINVNGTVYSGWKTIENVKRYDGSDFISLTQ